MAVVVILVLEMIVTALVLSVKVVVILVMLIVVTALVLSVKMVVILVNDDDTVAGAICGRGGGGHGDGSGHGGGGDGDAGIDGSRRGYGDGLCGFDVRCSDARGSGPVVGEVNVFVSACNAGRCDIGFDRRDAGVFVMLIVLVECR